MWPDQRHSRSRARVHRSLVPAAFTIASALCIPPSANLEPAQDEADGLAAPMSSSPPAAAESAYSSSASAFVTWLDVTAVTLNAFDRELVTEFGYPAVASAAPDAAKPPIGEPQTAALDPISSLAVCTGTAPERPRPAIPRPGLRPLEYQSQRAAAVPANRIAPLHSPLPLALPLCSVPLSPETPDELLSTNRAPKILPFQDSTVRPERWGRRVNVSAFGKIAAMVMIGVALWSGSRVADITRHTEPLKAEVTASPSGTAITGWQASDRGPGSFGGPIRTVRQAIASRAATEITDTFKSGMVAWGAQTQAWAPGWKRHPQGYVSVGEMALFQPSLKYTDYRMEFYGADRRQEHGLGGARAATRRTITR